MTNPYTFTDNPMVSGVSVCNTDIVNDNIMALKWMHDHISYRSIGEIVASTIPLTDSGLHLLDGALISGSGSYGDFVTYISGLVSTHPDLFTTESNWQSTVTQYGVCGKFVYDSTNNTVRLPKITGFVEGTINPTVLGDLTEAGLPNITGRTGSNNIFSDLFTQQEFTGGIAGGSFYTYASLFDASHSSSIYGNSSTVQPQSVKVLYYIVIATSTKTDIQVDIDEIATDLNGKADVDLSNVTNTSGFRKLVEVYNNGTSWYKVYREYNPQNGNYIGLWCEQGGVNIGTNVDQATTFLKPFSSTNYVLHCINHENSTSAWSNRFGFNKTRTGFTSCANTGVSWDWQACGYIN